LNQHGTRALQKMIEYVNAPEQVQTIINALSGRVVELVGDTPPWMLRVATLY
jgi:hypothetical protein